MGFWQARLERHQLHLVAREQALERPTSKPSSSTGTPITRAPVWRSESSMPAKVGDSTTATSPGSSVARAVRLIPCLAPEVTMISSGSSAKPQRAPARGELLANA